MNNVIEKWYNRWLRLLAVLFPGQINIAQRSWHFGDFCNIFFSNIGEDQKKSYHLSAGPLALCHMINPALFIALRS